MSPHPDYNRRANIRDRSWRRCGLRGARRRWRGVLLLRPLGGGIGGGRGFGRLLMVADGGGGRERPRGRLWTLWKAPAGGRRFGGPWGLSRERGWRCGDLIKQDRHRQGEKKVYHYSCFASHTKPKKENTPATGSPRHHIFVFTARFPPSQFQSHGISHSRDIPERRPRTKDITYQGSGRWAHPTQHPSTRPTGVDKSITTKVETATQNMNTERSASK